MSGVVYEPTDNSNGWAPSLKGSKPSSGVPTTFNFALKENIYWGGVQVFSHCSPIK